ncbi:competence type IV pilus assembly protein ComGB [Cytobacillus sp. S13-E01]|uniref:competence type IV pilus assembly protein ComGB n=1 Tax=Cytobacillus sp. S13-E01 TaxID=3031326 RepID=UPI0023D7CD9D|nr:competence type IV pilus assembly protein ComGB [Cytobacillus sp. S13-E01]MDF0727791.1 competence type IV pilus assembly protein ComGB [Cytobacillus sp. S13-E01]
MNNKWLIQEQAVFLKRLGELLENGYPLSQGIEFLQLQVRDKSKQDLEKCLVKLKEGNTFYSILVDLKFHKDVLAYLFFAQKQGDISFALREGSAILERRVEYLTKIKKILRYPLFLVFFVGCMFILVERFLLPQFQQLYTSMNLDSSFFVNALSYFSTFIKLLLYGIISSCIFLLTFYFLKFKNLTAVIQMKLVMKVPLLNRLIVLLNSHFFSVQLSNLLKGGLSIYESITAFEEQNHSRFFREEAVVIKEQLSGGERLDWIIGSRNYFEKELALVILHGHSHGSLDKELYHYSQFTLERLDGKISSFLKICQPILFTSIGLIIVFMYLTIMLPMFKLINAI